MTYRNGNYAAFYVASPFSETQLGANSTPDFIYYNLLKAWKGADSSFPFNDSHSKTYNVRDGSDWESTLKPRLRERLRNSKNIILFLSSSTLPSKALNEEIEYGVHAQKLPLIIVYPEIKEDKDIYQVNSLNENKIKADVINLKNKIPNLFNASSNVPVLHIPSNKYSITRALSNSSFTVQSAIKANDYFYTS